VIAHSAFLDEIKSMGRANNAGPGIEPRPRVLRRLLDRSRWQHEDGIALVLTLIVMGVLTIGTAAVITEVNSNEQHFGRDRQVNRALNIAEAGLNAGLNAAKALPATATSLSPASGVTDAGSWSYTGTRTQDSSNPNLYYWTITSTGVSPDGRVSRIVSRKIAETITHHNSTQTVHHDASPAYGYGFFLGDPNSDCATLSGTGNQFGGNLQISVNIYVRGSLCLSGNQQILEPVPRPAGGSINLYVGKTLKLQGGNTSVGTSASKIKSAVVVTACIRGSVVTCSNGSSSHVYADTYGSTQNNLDKPTIDTSWYSNSRPGPTTGCNDDPTHPGDVAYMSTYPSGYTASTFKAAIFDNNSTMNTSLGTLDFLNFGSFDCRYYANDGTLVGQLKWQSGNPGTLTINGTIWMDANLAFSSNSNYAIVQGRGTIYATGTISFSGQAKICELPTSGSNCLGNYDANQNLLVLVAYNNGSQTTRGFSMTGSGGSQQVVFEGIAFTNGEFYEGGNAWLHGPVLADTANMAGNGDTRTIINPPPGSPGAAYDETVTESGDDTAAWADVDGSWRQLK
jgi:Tfp pilus assembly protein PilX